MNRKTVKGGLSEKMRGELQSKKQDANNTYKRSYSNNKKDSLHFYHADRLFSSSGKPGIYHGVPNAVFMYAQIRPMLFMAYTNRKVDMMHRALVMATHSAASSPSPPIDWAMG